MIPIQGIITRLLFTPSSALLICIAFGAQTDNDDDDHEDDNDDDDDDDGHNLYS
jgi:hypothetical protein